MSDTPSAAVPSAPGTMTNGDMVQHLANGGTRAPTGDVGSYSDGFSPDQLAQMAAWAVEDGSLSREEAQAALQAHGIAPQQSSNDAVGDHLRGLGLGFEPAPDPSAYNLPQFADDNAPVGGVMQVDKTVRGWLHAARLPAAIGSSIAESINRQADRIDRMNPAERAEWTADQQRQLQTLWKGEFAEKVALAQQLVAEVDAATGGELIGFLEETGVGDDAFVIMQLAEHAHRISLRRKGS